MLRLDAGRFHCSPGTRPIRPSGRGIASRASAREIPRDRRGWYEGRKLPAVIAVTGGRIGEFNKADGCRTCLIYGRIASRGKSVRAESGPQEAQVAAQQTGTLMREQEERKEGNGGKKIGSSGRTRTYNPSVNSRQPKLGVVILERGREERLEQLEPLWAQLDRVLNQIPSNQVPVLTT
jgi:hypothetical protein